MKTVTLILSSDEIMDDINYEKGFQGNTIRKEEKKKTDVEKDV